MLLLSLYQGKEINPSSSHTDADSWRLPSLSHFVTDQIQRWPSLEENNFMKPCWKMGFSFFSLFFNDVECRCGIKINSELCNSIRMSQSLLRQLLCRSSSLSISFFSLSDWLFFIPLMLLLLYIRGLKTTARGPNMARLHI